MKRPAIIATAIAAFITTSTSFSIPSCPSSPAHHASLSPSNAKRQGHKVSVASLSPLFRTLDSPADHSVTISALFMADGDADEDVKEAPTETETEDSPATSLEAKSSNNDSSDDTDLESGFFMTLLLAPPLIAKFCVVLLVKFLTDAVVYPTLFLLRLAGRVKKKILGIFGKGGDDETKPINGEGTNGDFA